MYGYIWTSTETNSNFSKWHTLKSSSKWSIFCMDSYACQCFTRFNFRSFIFLDIHKWPCWRHFINCQIICWWYKNLLLSMTSMYLLTKFRRDVYVVLSVENVIHLDNSKQAQEITYSKKKRNFLHPPFLQWKNMVGCSYHKYLGVYLDKKLNFQQHIKKKIAKPSIIFGLQNTGFHVMGQI